MSNAGQKEEALGAKMGTPEGAPQLQDRIRLPDAARFEHGEIAQNQNGGNVVEIEDVFAQEELYSSSPRGRRGISQKVGWFDMNESEIGDFPFDDLTGLQTSSPEELSDSMQPAFFSVRSYHRRARRLAEFSRIDSSLLSRPLSAPSRLELIILSSTYHLQMLHL